MPDRTIPFFNTIMKCSVCARRRVELPDGFAVVPYRPGYEKDWAELEYAIGDFGSVREAEEYFTETYLRDPGRYPDILFARDRDGRIAGSCIAWQDTRGEGRVSSLHWLVVGRQYRGLGLGRTLSAAVMNIFAERGAFPVYIHTQPWSWKAILLYLSLGFRLQKTDTFSHYENEYGKAMAELRKIVTAEQYELLRQSSED